MATSRTIAARSAVGFFFLVAGVLYLLGILFSYVAPSLSSQWWNFFAFALIAVAFLLMFLWRVSSLLRVAFIVAAVGWAILAIGTIASLGAVLTVAIVLALIGTLLSGILVVARHALGRRADPVFLVFAVLATLLLLSTWVTWLGGIVETVVSVLFGVFLVAAGLAVQRRR
jgi:hypothetical protein